MAIIVLLEIFYTEYLLCKWCRYRKPLIISWTKMLNICLHPGPMSSKRNTYRLVIRKIINEGIKWHRMKQHHGRICTMYPKQLKLFQSWLWFRIFNYRLQQSKVMALMGTFTKQLEIDPFHYSSNSPWFYSWNANHKYLESLCILITYWHLSL